MDTKENSNLNKEENEIKSTPPPNETIITMDHPDSQLLEIINHLVKSKAHFKSQQRGDPELSEEEKRTISLDIFSKSPTLFLSRFGLFLRKEDLSYFKNLQSPDYEMTHHLSKLQRYFDKPLRQIDVRNRRYEALKALIEGGEYFSETEMMKRNPLLYEQLVGQYMTEDEKKIRDLEEVQDKTLSGMLLECFDRRVMNDLQVSQQDAEECAEEEEEDSDEDSEGSNEKLYNKENKEAMKEPLWGEDCVDENNERDPKEGIRSRFTKLDHKELSVLRQEFVTNMYQSFLDGKDTDFDYSTVDDNEKYDDIVEKIQDEEDKYFDSEEPEEVVVDAEKENSDSEDELDKYMRMLKESEKVSESTKDCTIK